MAGVPSPLALRLDEAVGELLAAPIARVDRVELEVLQAVLAPPPAAPRAGLDPPSLSRALLDYLMPRLTDPGVLRLERRRELLGALAAGGDPVSRHEVLRQELRGLALLRGNRDSLIEG